MATNISNPYNIAPTYPGQYENQSVASGFTKEELGTAPNQTVTVVDIPQDPNFKVTIGDSINTSSLTNKAAQTQYNDLTAQRTAEDLKRQEGLMAAYIRKTEGRATPTDLTNLDYAISKGIFKVPALPATETKTNTPVTPAGPTVPGTNITPGPGLTGGTPAPTPTPKVYKSPVTDALDKLIAAKQKNIGQKPDITGILENTQEANRDLEMARQAVATKKFLDAAQLKEFENKVIPMSFIGRQKERFTSDEYINNLSLAMDYNNKQILAQIANSNYAEAEKLVKEIADDEYDVAQLMLDKAVEEQRISTEERAKLDKEADEQRDLAKQGFIYISDPKGLKGLTEEQIYRDPVSGRIYKVPANISIIEVGGRKKLFDSTTNKIVGDIGASGSGSGGGSGGGVTGGGIEKANVKVIKDNLLKEIGDDGFLNPADYNLAKKDWISLGGSPTEFDKEFSDRRNPENTYYDITGKTNPMDENKIEALKNDGRTEDEIIEAGYDEDTVNKIFEESDTKRWYEFWR